MAELKAQAQRANIAERVLFTGALTGMENVYPAFDVMTLISRSEGFGRVLAEAASCGVAGVGSRVGGIEEVIVDGETGLLVTFGYAAGLATTILQLLADPARLRQLGDAARQRATRIFSVAEHGRMVNNRYLKLLGEKTT